MKDLMCIGLTTLDILARPVDSLPIIDQTTLVEEISLSPAGTAGGTAVIAARLGMSTGLISAIGDDANGRVLTLLMSEANVDTTYLTTNSQMPTSTTVLTIRSDGERPNLHMLGASVLSTFTAESLAAAKNAKVLHFAGLGFPQLAGQDTIEALASLRESGVKISCDLIAPQPETFELLPQFLPHIDVFMPSQAEVSILLGSVSMQDALMKFIELGAKNCIIKMGSKGAIGMINGELIEFPARNITPVDTTSCGDAFCAGIIYGLVHNISLDKAAIIGITTASLVAQGLGTLGALTSIDEVLKLVELES